MGGASLSGAGALGVLCVAFVAVQKWTDEEKVCSESANSFYFDLHCESLFLH